VFYLRLAAGPDNVKGDLEDRAVTFVTHGQGDDQWRSVVATGRLRSTTDDAVAIDALEGFREVQIRSWTSSAPRPPRCPRSSTGSTPNR
jgi:nitroimidazol reductase NimA-like FMN-containing flavoprotein (pyridoxamine 5'-phosphate oxidase superfamily)